MTQKEVDKVTSKLEKVFAKLDKIQAVLDDAFNTLNDAVYDILDDMAPKGIDPKLIEPPAPKKKGKK